MLFIIYEHFTNLQDYLSWHSHSYKLLSAIEKQDLRIFEDLLLVPCERTWIHFDEVIEILVSLETEQKPDQVTISIASCQLPKLNTHLNNDWYILY